MSDSLFIRKKLTLAQRGLGELFQEEFAPRLSIAISPLEGMLLDFLCDSGSESATEAAAEFNLNKSTLSEAFFSLEKKGLIDSFVSEEDKRKKRLVVTERGWRLFEEMNRLHADFEREVAEMMGGADKRDRLLESLDLLNDALSRRKDGRN